MSEEWLGIVSLLILFSVIFIGFPIAFTITASCVSASATSRSGRSRCI